MGFGSVHKRTRLWNKSHQGSQALAEAVAAHISRAVGKLLNPNSEIWNRPRPRRRARPRCTGIP
jgi:hypothetical protein